VTPAGTAVLGGITVTQGHRGETIANYFRYT
jgi:hypothetical protein